MYVLSIHPSTLQEELKPGRNENKYGEHILFFCFAARSTRVRLHSVPSQGRRLTAQHEEATKAYPSRTPHPSGRRGSGRLDLEGKRCVCVMTRNRTRVASNVEATMLKVRLILPRAKEERRPECGEVEGDGRRMVY